MNLKESKELAKKLLENKVEIIGEAIEGVYLGFEELPEEISMFLSKGEEYLVYLNPTYDDMVVVHVTLEDEVKVSYLTDEDGAVKEVLNDNWGMV